MVINAAKLALMALLATTLVPAPAAAATTGAAPEPAAAVLPRRQLRHAWKQLGFSLAQRTWEVRLVWFLGQMPGVAVCAVKLLPASHVTVN
jgi:hypothetical protein